MVQIAKVSILPDTMELLPSQIHGMDELLTHTAQPDPVSEFAHHFINLLGSQLHLDAAAFLWQGFSQSPYGIIWKLDQGSQGPSPVEIDVRSDLLQHHAHLASWLDVQHVQTITLESSSWLSGAIVLGANRELQLTPDEYTLLKTFQSFGKNALDHLSNLLRQRRASCRYSKRKIHSQPRSLASRLQKLSQDNKETIFHLNREGIITYVNRSLHSYGLQNIVGRNLSEWLPEEYQSIVGELLTRVFEFHEVQEQQVHWRRGNSAPFWASISFFPVMNNGKEQYAVVVLTDITSRKIAEEALYRYQLLAENAHEMVVFSRAADGRILDANRAALEAYGYSAKEIKTLTVWNLRSPREHSTLWEQLRQAQQTGLVYETFNIRKNDEEFPVEVSSQGIDLNGERVVLSVVRDITARRQAEERLQRQVEENMRLLTQAQRRTRELEIIAEISESLRKAQTQAEIIPMLVEKMISVLGAQAGGLLLMDGNRIRFLAGTGALDVLSGVYLPVNHAKMWTIIRTGEPFYLRRPFKNEKPDTAQFLRILNDSIQALALVPIKVSDTTIGIFCAGYESLENSYEESLNLAKALADIAANALQRTSIRERLEEMVANRTKELEAIYDITAVASESWDLHQLLNRAFDLTLLATKLTGGAILLLDETETYLDLVVHRSVPEDVVPHIQRQLVSDCVEGSVVFSNELLIVQDMGADSRFPLHALHPEDMVAWVGVPMRVNGKVVGVLTVTGPGGHIFGIDELALISSISDQLGLIVENVRLHQRAEQAAVMEERSRLARELHDSVTQSLYSLTLYANAGKTLAQQGDREHAQNYLARIGEISQQALKEMRLLVYELRPPVLDEDGLIGAIQQRLDAVEGRSGVRGQITARRDTPIPLRIEEALYRIALEALNNTLKHASASDVSVNVETKDGLVRMAIQDNGCGFDLTNLQDQGGIGLLSMRERAMKMGGEVAITSAPGEGTTVVVEIPLKLPELRPISAVGETGSEVDHRNMEVEK